jgi:hypothetical protein
MVIDLLGRVDIAPARAGCRSVRGNWPAPTCYGSEATVVLVRVFGAPHARLASLDDWSCDEQLGPVPDHVTRPGGAR